MNIEINWALIWPILAIQAVLTICALISLYKSDKAAVRGPKLMWAAIILFVSVFGSIAYFIAGRKEL